MQPVKTTPVTSLTGRLVGTRVRLANGSLVWALVENVDLDSPLITQHFLSILVERDGKWFDLARYFDVDYRRRGPDALAAFLGLGVADVFPIAFDIAAVALGESLSVTNVIPREQQDQLNKDQLIALSIP